MHLFSKNVIDKIKKLFIFRINYSKKMKYLTKFFDKTKLKIRKQENKTRVFHNLKKIGKKEKREEFFRHSKHTHTRSHMSDGFLKIEQGL